MRLVVSACLLGKNCKYDGENNYSDCVLEFCKGKDFVGVCPEELGGLSTPRNPSEIVGKKVLSNSGIDVTMEFQRGAKKSLSIAQEHGAKVAILKSRSPSCGCGEIYDGSFSKKLKLGNGITSKLFLENGIRVYGEHDIEAIKEKEEE